jgi:AraC family transcriptional regulator, arabinose operon regulatory protein
MRTPSPSPRVDRVMTGRERRLEERCWRPAGTEAWLLLHTLGGRARIVHPGGESEVGAGETILYQPGAPQDFGGIEPEAAWEIVWAHFEPLPHWAELLRWDELAAGVLYTKVSDAALLDRVEGLLVEADRLCSSGLPHAKLLARNVLEAALLWWDLRHPTGRPVDPRIVEAIDYISRHAGRSLSVDQLAARVHLSASRFSHLFGMETGLSPRRFVERQRIERSRQLLELTSLPVNVVAREAGFESQFYFATRFRAVTGLTPTEYRRAARSRQAAESSRSG